MKLTKYMAVAAALLTAACTDSAIDDLTGVFPAPDNVVLTTATDKGVTKDGNKRIFAVDFTNGAGDVLAMKFVGDAYYLHSASFTPAEAEKAKKGNYIIGTDGSTYAAAGQGPQAIVKGSLIVSFVEAEYTAKGTLWIADGKIVKIDAKGTLAYAPDPEPMHLTQVLSAQSNVPSGTMSVTLNLGTDGLSTTPNAWGGTDIAGDGYYLAVDFYSADGTLAPGTYGPADSSALAEFTYCKGWDPGDLWGIGMVFENWGTCWWTVEDGVATAQHIEEGDITVEYADGVFTISYAQGGLSFQYKGAIEGIEGVSGGNDNPPATEYVEISNFLSAAFNTNCVSLQLAEDGISSVPNAWGGADLTGDGHYLKIDLYSADGTIAEGTYTPADNTELAEGNFTKGYDPGDIWGIGMEFKNWGTAWMTRDGAGETGENITEGTITVEKSGSDYVITLTSPVVNVRYTGPINL